MELQLVQGGGEHEVTRTRRARALIVEGYRLAMGEMCHSDSEYGEISKAYDDARRACAYPEAPNPPERGSA